MKTVPINEDVEVKDKSDGKQEMEMKPKDKNDATNKDTLASQSRWLITTRQMSKLAKGENTIFLAIVRPTNETPPVKKSNK